MREVLTHFGIAVLVILNIVLFASNVFAAPTQYEKTFEVTLHQTNDETVTMYAETGEVTSVNISDELFLAVTKNINAGVEVVSESPLPEVSALIYTVEEDGLEFYVVKAEGLIYIVVQLEKDGITYYTGGVLGEVQNPKTEI